MIISVNWLKKYTTVDLPIDELATLIGERLVEIENVVSLAEKYQDVIVARVVECAPLEGSDHLNVTRIDDGGAVANVERDADGYVQVVCGAPNVRQGMLVAWLPPRSVVPETYGSADPFVLDSRALRGVMSHGMLASAKELDLFDDHSGIIEVDVDARPGASFASVYELDDYLLDIENKSLTHRPDTFGLVGFAREVAGILGKPFTTPDWLLNTSPVIEPIENVDAPAVSIESAELSDRFQAIVFSHATENATSPLLMQTYLARSGVRPINALVDVSNYLMLLTGQPTHAYDYDKLKVVAGDDFTVRVRLARQGEQLQLLDGKMVTLDESDIVIAAGDTAVGLAGIMGGKSTAVDSQTKTILLEAATFDLYRMRASQMRHGIFSEAVTRFTKGIPSVLSAPVLARAAEMLHDNTGAVVASKITEDYPVNYVPVKVEVSETHINDTLGTTYAAEDIADLLENVGFEVSFEQLVAKVTVPYWRRDVHLPEDVIEEVGRLAGFDTINPVLPVRSFVATRPGALDVLRSRLRDRLVKAGGNEVLTYSFVHADVLKKAGQDPNNAYRIVNSISPDLQHYRQSLTPSLLTHVYANVKSGYDAFALFELNKVHEKSWGLTDESVPVESNRLSLVVADAKASGAAYYTAKHLLEFALSGVGIVCRYASADESQAYHKPYETKRSARIVDAASGIELGVIGEFTKTVQKNFKLPQFSAGFEIDLDRVLECTEKLSPEYRAPSKYPGTERDICFQVADSIPYGHIYSAAVEALVTTGLIYTVSPVDIYRADGAEVKNVTIRIGLGSYEKTMTNDEISEVINSVTRVVTGATDGKVV